MCNITTLKHPHGDLIKTRGDKVFGTAIFDAMMAGKNCAANGIFWCDKDDKIGYYKIGDTGDVLYRNLSPQESLLPKYVRWACIHNRVPTSSSAKQNQNNHPFHIPPIIGCHMGFVHYNIPYRAVFENDEKVTTDSAQFLAIVADSIKEGCVQKYEEVEAKITYKMLLHDVMPVGLFVFATYDDPSKLFKIARNADNDIKITEIHGFWSNILSGPYN
jgi:hypothetical protein